MKIHFFATLRPIAGQKTVEFDLPQNITVRQLVEAVVTRFPPMRRELLDEEGELYPHVHVFVNGRDAPYLEKRMETIVRPEDTVNIFPAVGGGQEMTRQEVHAIPLWLLREYLEEVGGTAVSETRVVGGGWRVDLIKLEPKKLGSLRVGQVMLEMTGAPDALEKLLSKLHKKTMRAGA
ncbi:MAG: MoaD/ThiS family protein [bacterium]|nr:MoaD/ThiS family protein [bacterium]